MSNQDSPREDELIQYMEACALIARNGADIHPGNQQLVYQAGMLSAVVTALRELAQAKERIAELDQERTAVYDSFSIGSAVRTLPTLLANIGNSLRRSDCLSAVEHEFFTTTITDEDGDEGEECSLNWGSDPKQYVEHFRQALKDRAPAQPSIESQAQMLERALQTVMARLADLLDEDQFKQIEAIVLKAGVPPPQSEPAQPREAP